MRVAAVALVLIVGAAVVLWFANTLNSWIVGGLIGGLAALLLSIPISLTLFSFLARRHDEQLMAVEQEEVSLARSYDYNQAAEFAEVYETDVYMLPPAQEEQSHERHIPVTRNLPAPVYARLPAPRQSQASAYPQHAVNRLAPERLPAPGQSSALPQRSTIYSSGQQAQVTPVGRGKAAPTQHLTSDQRPYYPGLLGYRGSSPYSSHQSAALRTARLEAVQGRNGGTTSNLKRLPSTRPTANRPAVPRPSRQLPEQPLYPARPRRTIDEHSFAQPQMRRQINEPQTDGLHGRYPQTGPVRQQPRTGQMARNMQADEQQYDAEINTGSLRNPLVRRAPYMYEDDPLRQELAQHIEAPTVRRSSRYVDEE